MAVERILCYCGDMKAFMIVTFVLLADPSFSLQRTITHDTREVCEVQEGMLNQEVSSHEGERKYVVFGGLTWIFEHADCFDVPLEVQERGA